MPNFELKRLTEYTDEAIIAEIQRVARVVGLPKLTHADFGKHARISWSTVARHFGSWREGLIAAGLRDLCCEPSYSPKTTKKPTRGLSDEEILYQLKAAAAKAGTSTLNAKEFDRQATITSRAVGLRFGSWRKALRAAGLEDMPLGRKYTDEECFENLLKVWTHYGRQPKHAEMKKPPSSVGPKAYILRWGGWTKALYAFVEKVNSDLKEAVPSPSETEEAVEVQDAKPRRAPQSERREISLGLRYDVLKRDRFRCVLCGRSPATHLGCDLHVDHIDPFSKGGKTVPENLRSACSLCNIGKSDKLES